MRRLLTLAPVIAVALLASGCVFNVTSYTEPGGSQVYVGEVRNDGPPLARPYVTGTFYDAAGNLMGTQSAPVCRVMPTGSVAAFKLELPYAVRPARAEWKLNGTPVENAYLAEGLTAKLTSVGPRRPNPGNTIYRDTYYGEMRNESQNTYTGGHVCVAWVNANGEVVRVATGEVAGLRNAPGQVLPFAVEEYAPSDATDVLFFLDAVVTPPGVPPLVIRDLPRTAFRHGEERAPFDENGSYYSGLGEVHNSGSEILSIYTSAIARDAGGKPVGVRSREPMCTVPAFPGSFTFAGYYMETTTTPPPPLELKIEGVVLDPNSVAPLTPANVVLTDPDELTETPFVTVTVKNTTGRRLEAVVVCAAGYDSSGMMNTASRTFPQPGEGLDPGESRDFILELPRSGEIDSVKAIAAGS
mgnify:CR=1 FL=1